LLVVVSLLAGIAAAAYSLSRPRRYEAALALTTVASPRGSGLTQAFPASLLSGFTTGLQPTPALIAQLVRSRTSMNEVARTTVPGRGATVAQLFGNLKPNAPDYEVYRALMKAVSVSIDRESGLLLLSVTHRDSSLARFLAAGIVESVSRAFRTAARSQAHEVRQSQEVRVDSAARQLHRVEEQLAAFTRQNRVVTPYSAVAVENERLNRAVNLAQTVYTQVVSEREAAIGKELEETPAVVVVDPMPRQLVPMSRGTAAKAVLAAGVVFMLLAVTVVVRDLFRRGDSTEEEDRVRLRKAMWSKPFARAPRDAA
jgi:capsule polysaccharide export protein KpsE/RkpR